MDVRYVTDPRTVQGDATEEPHRLPYRHEDRGVLGGGQVEVDGVRYEVGRGDLVSIGRGSKRVPFASPRPGGPVRLHLATAPVTSAASDSSNGHILGGG